MRLNLLSALPLLLSTVAAQAINPPQQEWPINQTAYTDAVQWDHYSLWVNQERLFVWSGEFVCPYPEALLFNRQKGALATVLTSVPK